MSNPLKKKKTVGRDASYIIAIPLEMKVEKTSRFQSSISNSTRSPESNPFHPFFPICIFPMIHSVHIHVEYLENSSSIPSIHSFVLFPPSHCSLSSLFPPSHCSLSSLFPLPAFPTHSLFFIFENRKEKNWKEERNSICQNSI